MDGFLDRDSAELLDAELRLYKQIVVGDALAGVVLRLTVLAHGPSVGIYLTDGRTRATRTRPGPADDYCDDDCSLDNDCEHRPLPKTSTSRLRTGGDAMTR
jgi:hypothetical protein